MLWRWFALMAWMVEKNVCFPLSSRAWAARVCFWRRREKNIKSGMSFSAKDKFMEDDMWNHRRNLLIRVWRVGVTTVDSPSWPLINFSAMGDDGTFTVVTFHKFAVIRGDDWFTVVTWVFQQIVAMGGCIHWALGAQASTE